MMSFLQEIDGRILEGGGQILRLSVAFSAILGVPIRVFRIRAGRAKPGLAAQHLKGLELVAEMCQAKTKGLELGSTEIEFVPGQIKGGHYFADCVTAGSVGLLLQAALPCALLADAPVTLELKGGTNAEMAPQVDYLTEVFRPLLNMFGGSFDFNLHKRGYFPRGGGHVTVTVTPVRGFRAVTLTDLGQVERISGWSYVAGTLPVRLAHQMSEGARHSLGAVCRSVEIDCYKEDAEIAPDNCNGMVLVCTSSTGCVLGADALGKRGAEPATLGRQAADQLAGTLRRGACVDRYAQDQLIIYMALATGQSAIRVADVTLHTKTAMFIATSISHVEFNEIPSGNTTLIECQGLAFNNKYLPS